MSLVSWWLSPLVIAGNGKVPVSKMAVRIDSFDHQSVCHNIGKVPWFLQPSAITIGWAVQKARKENSNLETLSPITNRSEKTCFLHHPWPPWPLAVPRSLGSFNIRWELVSPWVDGELLKDRDLSSKTADSGKKHVEWTGLGSNTILVRLVAEFPTTSIEATNPLNPLMERFSEAF